MTDTLTLLVLAVVGGLFKGESGGLFWLWLVVKVIFLGALIMYSFPRIGRWFFRRYDDNVMQFIFVLAMVFLGAGLMEIYSCNLTYREEPPLKFLHSFHVTQSQT